MSRWKLWFVLLLLLPFCTDNKGISATQELLVKTISEEPDVTPICTNDTVNIVLLIVCKIHTERSRGGECQLLYRHGQDFVHECDSRFSLMIENQTVFLHLINLTPEDSGNYTCECVRHGGTIKLQLNVTVEEGDKVATNSSSETPFFFAVIGVPVLITTSAVTLGLICSKKCLSRRHQVLITSVESTALYTQADETEQSDVFIQKENVIYGL